MCGVDTFSVIPWNDVFSSHKRGHCIADHQGFVVQCWVIYKPHVFKAAHQGIEAAKMLIITRPEADLTAKIPVFLKKLFFLRGICYKQLWFICSQKLCWYLLSGYHIPLLSPLPITPFWLSGRARKDAHLPNINNTSHLKNQSATAWFEWTFSRKISFSRFFFSFYSI